MSIDFQLSEHCTKERVDRLTFIMVKTGLGEIFCEYQRDEKTLYRITTTGVLLIIDPRWMVLVSAYYVNYEKAYAICCLCPNKNLKMGELRRVIRANEKLQKEQDKVFF